MRLDSSPLFIKTTLAQSILVYLKHQQCFGARDTFTLSRVSSFLGRCKCIYNRIPDNVQNKYVTKFKRIVKKRLCGKGYYNIR
ncbi:unnamed protein product [Leptidea sinapis]|uniref:Uncharacterized protein n=1 Tax=Leptidea sinapis TaxID=189913 RepID=A0A5E4PSZ8_9NEOP|nr:unnamed protein product [Leptidea sinapis]